jgi:hypothetical protein
MSIHLLHGIHTPTGDPTVERLIPYLPQPVKYPDYGYILALQTRFVNPMITGCIGPYVEDGDILVGHSNGAALQYEIARNTGKKVGLVLINAALNQAIVVPPNVLFVHVYYNAGDDVTEVARIAAALAISPVDVVWGEMGHAGYEGQDPRVLNFDCGFWPNMPAVSGHSDIFSPDKITSWGPFIAGQIVKAYNGIDLPLSVSARLTTSA